MTLSKITTSNEFLDRFKAQDPEIMSVWEELTDILRNLREDIKPHLERYDLLMEKLGLEGAEWLLASSLESLDEPTHESIYSAVKRMHDLQTGVIPDKSRNEESLIHEIEVEWDILAAASDTALRGIELLEVEYTRNIPARLVWNLRHSDFGDFGTISIVKIRSGWSQVEFTGFQFSAQLPPALYLAKRKILQQVIAEYYRSLAEQNIWTDKAEIPSPVQPPWMMIPDELSHRRIIELWCSHWSVKQIAREMFLQPETTYNIISQLRKKYPQAKIPRDRERNLK